MKKANIVLKANSIFTNTNGIVQKGFIAIKENKIIYVGNENIEKYIDEKTEIFELGDNIVFPGFVDAHCFFTGHLLSKTGIDLSLCITNEDVIKEITKIKSSLKSRDVIIGRNIKSERISFDVEGISKSFENIPVILFREGFESCYMNECAIKTYNFTNEECWSEKIYLLLKDILCDKEFSKKEFIEYMKMLNTRGVTSIKEMGFDDYSGFVDVLEELEKENKLTCRVNFMSQPVGKDVDIDFGISMRDRFKGDFIKFQGYNQMTDGSISQFEALMKQPYENKDFCCKKHIDWNSLEKDVLKADENGFRFSLHAQGDMAIKKCIDIFDKCEKNEKNMIKRRHAITDLECGDVEDFKKMGELGVVAEIYPQIMSLYNSDEKIDLINSHIGKIRSKKYWSRRQMIDKGVVISCATDLPLLYTDIPESMYNSVFGLFNDSYIPFNEENTISKEEILKAWTFGGQYNLNNDNILGEIEAGKLCDIVVFNKNIFNLEAKEIKNVDICMTIVNGVIVYNKL